MSGSIQAFPANGDIVVAASPYADNTHVVLTALRPDGSTDPRYGSHGTAGIRTPWQGSNAAAAATISTHYASPNQIVVVATGPGNQLILTRVHG